MEGDIDPPPELAEMLAMVAGESWPDVSEMDILRRARALKDACEDTKPLDPLFMTAVRDVLTITRGEGARAFLAMTEKFAQGDGSEQNPGAFPGLIMGSGMMGEALQTSSNNVETSKITIIGMAALVFVELLAAAISLVITFGAASVVGAALIKTTILLIRKLITQLIKSILKGALMMGGMNLLAQVVQIFRGHRDGLDFAELGKTAALGAGAGVIGFGIGKGLGKIFGSTGFGGIINNTLTEGLTEHVLAGLMPLFDPQAQYDNPGDRPFAGGFFEGSAEALNHKAKNTNVFNKVNVPVPAMNFDIPNLDVNLYLEKGTSTGAPLPGPGIGLFSGKTGMVDPATGTFIDPPAGAPGGLPTGGPARTGDPGDPPPPYGDAPPAYSGPGPDQPASAPAPEPPAAPALGPGPAPGPAGDPAPAPTPSPAPAPAPAPTAGLPGSPAGPGPSNLVTDGPVPDRPGPSGSAVSPGPAPDSAPGPAPSPSPSPTPAPAPGPTSTADLSGSPAGPGQSSLVTEGPGPGPSVVDGPVPDRPDPSGPAASPAPVPEPTPGPGPGPSVADGPVPDTSAADRPEPGGSMDTGPVTDTGTRPAPGDGAPAGLPDAPAGLLDAPAGLLDAPAPGGGTSAAPPTAPAPESAPAPAQDAPAPSGGSVPTGPATPGGGPDSVPRLSGNGGESTTLSQSPQERPGGGTADVSTVPSAAPRAPEQQPGAPGGTPSAPQTGPAAAPGAVPASPGGPPVAPPPPPPPVSTPQTAPPAGSGRPQGTPGAGQKAGQKSGRKGPTPVPPSPHPVSTQEIAALKAHVTPVPLRTERFDPAADPLATAGNGQLGGTQTLIRPDVSRFQASDGSWIRGLTITLPVKVGPAGKGLTPEGVAALEQRIQDLLDAQVNTGYTLPRSGDQLHIDIALKPTARPGGEGITVTYSADPGRSDQLHFNLHGPGATPAQEAKDAGKLLHEVLHYTGLGDYGQDNATLFRNAPDKAQTTGIMANQKKLPDGLLPQEYLAEIENTLDSGPVVNDVPFTGDGTPPEPRPQSPSESETAPDTETDIEVVPPTSQEPPPVYQSADQLLRDLLDTARSPDAPGFAPRPQESLLGPDVFGLRDPAPVPPFLAGLDFSQLTGDKVTNFLYAMDMVAGGLPGRDEVDPAGIQGDPAWVIQHSVDNPTAWAPGGNLDPLPAQLQTPWVIHSIWLGGPLGDTGAMKNFRLNMGKMAQQYQGSAMAALWTDVPRSIVDQALEPESPDDSPEVIAARSMVTWAQESNVMLLNVDEIFNSETPMKLHPFFKAEMNKQIGLGYAAASDILRLEIVRRFGGIYTDGDNLITDLAQVVPALQTPESYAFHTTAHTAGNSFMAMPQGHPVADKYLDLIAGQYQLNQKELFGPLNLPHTYFTTPHGKVHRNSIMNRTGPSLMINLSRELGMRFYTDFPGMGGLTVNSDASWIVPPAQPVSQAPPSGEKTLTFAQNIVQSLIRDAYNREGDFHATQANRAIARHQQAELVWEGVARFLASRPELANLFTQITDARMEEGGIVDTVTLPPAVLDLFDFAGPRAQGYQEGTYIAEHFKPVRFRSSPSFPPP
ncbi:hypothetical protein ABT354_16740 [Streptomyces sp. NPDC000594]|uniref:WXG100-like domain-containing protein n=1 Tax=Streptomyces sp. NPDC000594 TaxID=3154261 RepID=UPI0033258D3C